MSKTTLSGLGKKSILKIASSRGIISDEKETKKEIINKIASKSTNKGPFAINLDASQEEQVLSLTGISDYQLRKYLHARENTDREELISLLLGEELTPLSQEIISLSRESLRALRKQAGGEYLGKADAIRIILKIDNKFNEKLRNLEKQLEAIGFKLQYQLPSPRVPKPLTETPFTIQKLRLAIQNGEDVSTVDSELLEEVANDYTLTPKILTDEEVLQITRSAVTDPVLPEWSRIKTFLNVRDTYLINDLVKMWGFPELTSLQIDFLMSRGYLRDVERKQTLLDNASEQFRDFVDEHFPDGIEDLDDEDLSKQFLIFLSQFDQLAPKQAISFAEGYGISLSWKDPVASIQKFWGDADLYLEIDNSLNLTLENVKKFLDHDFLNRYSDYELIKFFPMAPYGRSKLLKSFREFWREEHWFYFNNQIYYGNIDNYQPRDAPDAETLEWDQLLEIVGWLSSDKTLRSIYLREICRFIREYEYEIDFSRVKRTPPLQNFFEQMLLTGVISIGGEITGQYPSEYRPVNQELLDGALAQTMLLAEPLRILQKLPMFKLRSLEFREDYVGDFSKPSIRWIETAIFYLVYLFDKEITVENFVISRL